MEPPVNRPPLWGRVGVPLITLPLVLRVGVGASLGQKQGMAARSFGNEPCPENLEPGFLEPGKVGLPVSMAPVHRRAVPVLLRSCPGAGSDGRAQIPARSQPAIQLS